VDTDKIGIHGLQLKNPYLSEPFNGGRFRSAFFIAKPCAPIYNSHIVRGMMREDAR